MGTQQLLLIVLGVIVVGTAVAIGIGVFAKNSDQATKDTLTHGCLRMAATAQGYFLQPQMLGGGGRSFVGINLRDCGLDEDTPGAGIRTTLEGIYSVTGATATDVQFIGTHRNDPTKIVTVNLDMSKPTETERVSVSYEGDW